MTPEGRVKKVVRDLLDGYSGMWTYWPVPSGYGRKTVDVLACFRGRFFAIEVKKDGAVPTVLQGSELQAVLDAGGRAFVVAGSHDPSLIGLKNWLDELQSMYPHDDTNIAPPQSSRPVL